MHVSAPHTLNKHLTLYQRVATTKDSLAPRDETPGYIVYSSYFVQTRRKEERRNRGTGGGGRREGIAEDKNGEKNTTNSRRETCCAQINIQINILTVNIDHNSFTD